MTERVAADGLTLRFAADGAGAVFHVYQAHALDQPPRRYLVGAGDRSKGLWPFDSDGRYDLWVLGPNGFLRHFAGIRGDAVPPVTWTVGKTGLTLDTPGSGFRLRRPPDVVTPLVRATRPRFAALPASERCRAITTGQNHIIRL